MVDGRMCSTKVDRWVCSTKVVSMTVVLVMVLVMVIVMVMVAEAANVRTTDASAQTHPDVPAVYNYKYGVLDEESATDFGHEETRDHDATSGRYYVLLPDGRVQTVLYSVEGDDGFVADVSYAKRRR
nr:pro-resilin-like [Cherax quadricarinatus]